jgi:hypothetical protein
LHFNRFGVIHVTTARSADERNTTMTTQIIDEPDTSPNVPAAVETNATSDTGEPKATRTAKAKATGKAKGGTEGAKGTPSKGTATKKATQAKNPNAGAKRAKSGDQTTPQGSSKTAQVVAMLQRKNGATITEIMEAMGWQRHTVRGFVAGALKKGGYTVESFKPDGGERSYRIPK